MEKLHTLNNLMPNQVGAVKNMCVAGVSALAAFAASIHGAGGNDTSDAVPSGLKLSELEVAFVTDAVPDKYRDKFAPFFDYLGSEVKDRKAFDFSDLAGKPPEPVTPPASDADEHPQPTIDRSSRAAAEREKANGPDMRLVAIEAIGRLRGTFLGLCG